MRDITLAEIEWMKTKVMPNYMIYSKQNAKAFCMSCHSEIDPKTLSTRKIGTLISCPCCGEKVKVKNEKYTATYYEFGTAIIPGREDGEFVLRYFNVSRHYKKGWREWEFDYRESARETFHKDGTFSVIDKRWADEKWKKCKLPYGEYRISWYTHKPLGTHAWFSNDNVNIYPRNLTKYSKGTNFERVPLYKIFTNTTLSDKYSAWRTISDANRGYANFFEYIFKIGVNNLAFELVEKNPYKYIRGEEKSIINMLSLSKENYKELLSLKNKATIEDLNKLQRYTEFNIAPKDREVFDKYLAKDTHIAKGLMEILPVILHQFGKWASKQKNFNLGTYKDYLSMCKELDLDMKNSFVSLPNELKSAHDMVTDMYNEMKFDMKLKRYADNANEYKSDYEKIVPIKKKEYSFDKGNMKVIVPENTREIGHEGYKLRHCVAQYMEDIVANKKTILFIRNVNELDTPFFTMEIVGKKITQCKGYRNCPRPAEVESFLKAFAKNKHLTIAKNEHFAAVM